MSTAIENSVQNRNVRQKEIEKPNLSKERVKTEEPQPQNIKDIVDIQSSSPGSIESNQNSNEIKDTDEVQKLEKEVAGLVNSENEISSVEQGENYNKGSLVDIMV